MQLDHIIIAVSDLDTAIQDYRALGFTTVRGGVHANRATHNALITFQDETYLELLAPTGEPPAPGLIDFSRILQLREGFVGFALRTADLDREAARLTASGLAVGDVILGERRRGDGVLVQWKLALLDDGFSPFLIQDVTPRERRIPRDPQLTTHANGALGLAGIEITAQDLQLAVARFALLFEPTPPPISLRAGERDALQAIRLICERPAQFPAEKTHGVRFLL